MILDGAERIWINGDPGVNEYAVFRCGFESEGETVLYICAESDYTAELNGKTVSFGAFAGYETVRYYDTADLTPFLSCGTNTLEITVRYEGIDSATHIKNGAGVIFRVCGRGKTLAESSAGTYCALSGKYISHEQRFISPQLGLSSSMTAAGHEIPSKATVSDIGFSILPRPVRKTELSGYRYGKEIRPRVYDLGSETAGYIFVKARKKNDALLKIGYGEHLADGAVRRIIGNRDFSLDFYLREGENGFINYFVRAAGRYLEAYGDAEIEEIGIAEYLYPQREREYPLCGRDKRIYDTAVRTLRLCMNAHYEDCPWREQALYTLDSRNQMLCGYSAFEDTSFQRANLIFIAKGLMPDGLLELTYPARNTPAIPFFSCIYPLQISEYISSTGDVSVLSEIYGTAKTIVETFFSRTDGNGLVADFGPPYWNFYEWSDGSDGYFPLPPGKKKYDLILNCAIIAAAEAFNGFALPEDVFDTDRLRRAVYETFYDEKRGLFISSDTDGIFTELGNAFAVLAGLKGEKVGSALLGKENCVEATLSARGFVYDALLRLNEKNSGFILADIRSRYGRMLDGGATSFWETEDGESAFGGAGSLCHGWSALPAYYLTKLIHG